MSGNLPRNWMNEIMPEPFCNCWDGDSPEPGNPDCGCGEELDIVKWRWEPHRHVPNWVELYQDRKQVVFHPFNSSGTAIAKGNIGIRHNIHYYWEIKMLTQPYGTDIMVGVGNESVEESIRQYVAYLGSNADSYALSYTGAICHNAEVVDDCPGFCKGTIIGVRVDMYHGTLEFYLNREPQGISFTDLRRHCKLFPVVSSTAAQSSIRLTYASAWTESLLYNAAKSLAASVTDQLFDYLPFELAQDLKLNFWIPLPSAGRLQEKTDRFIRARVKQRRF